MLWSTCVWDTQTGVKLADMHATAGSWQRGRVVEQTHTFPLWEQDYDRTTLRDIFGRFRPRDRVLSVLANGVPVYHGLILDTDYQPATKEITVTHKDVRELAANRWMHGINGSSQTFNWTGLSPRGLATRVARLAFTANFSAAWPLPISVPADEAGTKSLKFYGYEFRTAESLLTDISEMSGGPDVEFQPTIDGDGRFGWEFLVGDPYLSGPTLEYHLQAPESPLKNVNVKTIGSEKITGVHAIGEGSEWKMVRGGAAEPSASGLSRDTKLTLKDKKLAQVNDRAEGYLNGRRSTYQQWTFDLNADDVNAHLLRIGSIVRIESRGDPWISDGWTEHRILGFGGNLADPDTVSLTIERIS